MSTKTATKVEPTVLDEIKAKRPELAARAASGNVLSAIFMRCLECAGGSRVEVVDCPCADCPLFPFRLGKNTLRQSRQLTDEQRQAMAERLRAARTAAATNDGIDEADDDCNDVGGEE